MNNDKSDAMASRVGSLADLSDRILGAPEEIDVAEAEELLRAADIDTRQLKARFHRRFDELAKRYAGEGRRVPPLLKQALADLRPGVYRSRPQRELLREARAAIQNALKRAKRLPDLLAKTPDFNLAAAYRKKTELSEHDKKLLDEVVRNLEDLKNRAQRSARPKGGA